MVSQEGGRPHPLELESHWFLDASKEVLCDLGLLALAERAG